VTYWRMSSEGDW